MLRSILFLSLGALALAISADDLKVTIKAVSSSVDSIEDIILSAIVTNPTSEDIRVLAKNNVLDGGSTSSFAVSKDDKDLLFTGVRATIDPSVDGAYKTIPAGQSVIVNHTVAALYDFDSAGTGKFTFQPRTVFQTNPTEVGEASADAVTVEVKKDVARRELFPSIGIELSTPACSNAGRQNTIASALADARALAGGAATDILSHPNGNEYNTYFGGNTQSDIWFNMDRIAGDLSSSGVRHIYCSSDGGRDPAALCGANSGVIAYTLLVTQGSSIVSSDIYMCDFFFTSTGTTAGTCQGGFDVTQSSQGGVILHELSHAVFLTQDIAYGCTACAGLSVANKKANADNYRCMGLAIHKTYVC